MEQRERGNSGTASERPQLDGERGGTVRQIALGYKPESGDHKLRNDSLVIKLIFKNFIVIL